MAPWWTCRRGPSPLEARVPRAAEALLRPGFFARGDRAVSAARAEVPFTVPAEALAYAVGIQQRCSSIDRRPASGAPRPRDASGAGWVAILVGQARRSAVATLRARPALRRRARGASPLRAGRGARRQAVAADVAEPSDLTASAGAGLSRRCSSPSRGHLTGLLLTSAWHLPSVDIPTVTVTTYLQGARGGREPGD